MEYMTFPSPGVITHSFAKLIGISDLTAGIGSRTNTREWIITTLILKKNIRHFFNL